MSKNNKDMIVSQSGICQFISRQTKNKNKNNYYFFFLLLFIIIIIINVDKSPVYNEKKWKKKCIWASAEIIYITLHYYYFYF